MVILLMPSLSFILTECKHQTMEMLRPWRTCNSFLSQLITAISAYSFCAAIRIGQHPAGLPQGVSYLKTILAFNSHSPPNARYDGFQYDVEPYTLPGWPSAALENGTVALFDASDAAIRASGQHLTLSAAIPRWFGQPQFGFLDRKIIDRTDEVIVMDYVTTPQQLINDPSDILHYANEKHKGVWIGVETGDLPDTPKSTFHQLGNGAMEEELKTDMPLFQAQPSFRGYAIHHYGSYAALKP
jgi:hypothetical protein